MCEDGGNVPNANVNGEQQFMHVRFAVYLAQIAEGIRTITHNYAFWLVGDEYE